MAYKEAPKEANNPNDGFSNKAVQAAVSLIEDNYESKVERDGMNDAIQKLIEEGFEVSNPTGTRKISSKVLQQALWRTASRMKPLDFSIHGSSRPEEVEKIVTDGVGTVMDKGGYAGALRDKGGMFYKSLLYGDAFMQIGANPDEKSSIPIKFTPISNSNIYVDSFATGVRTGGHGQTATKVCVVFSYSWEEACRLYPELPKKAVKGEIPRESSILKDLERSYEQETETEDDKVEVAHFYDISAKNYTVFAGAMASVLSEVNGDDYPFVIDGEAYIPVSHWMCMPSHEGFYNHGIGDMIYDLAILSRELLNMGAQHAGFTANPLTILNMPQEEAARFFSKMKSAHEMRVQGKQAFVVNGYDPNNPNATTIQTQTITPQSALNEWQMIYDRLDREIRRLGINLDEADRGNVTATQIIAEEESANAFVKQVMENNASETKFLVKIAMDMIKKFVSDKDETPLDLTTTIEIGGEGKEIPAVPLGLVAKELKDHNYFVRVNSRSGAIPSNVLQQAQITRVLQATPPGTPAYFKLLKQFAQLNDRDISMMDLGAQPAAPQMPAQAGGEVPEEAMVAGTERIAVNPRQATPQPAF